MSSLLNVANFSLCFVVTELEGKQAQFLERTKRKGDTGAALWGLGAWGFGLVFGACGLGFRVWGGVGLLGVGM